MDPKPIPPIASPDETLPAGPSKAPLPVAVIKYRKALHVLLQQALESIPFDATTLTQSDTSQIEKFLLDTNLFFGNRQARLDRAKTVAGLLLPANQNNRPRHLMRVALNLTDAHVGHLPLLYGAAQDAMPTPKTSVTTDAPIDQAEVGKLTLRTLRDHLGLGF